MDVLFCILRECFFESFTIGEHDRIFRWVALMFRLDFLDQPAQSWWSFKRRRPNWWDQHRNELISFPLSQLLWQLRQVPVYLNNVLYTQWVPTTVGWGRPIPEGGCLTDKIPVRADVWEPSSGQNV